jgi:phosphatidylinositol-3-phosphatase
MPRRADAQASCSVRERSARLRMRGGAGSAGSPCGPRRGPRGRRGGRRCGWCLIPPSPEDPSASGSWRAAHQTIPSSMKIGIFRTNISQMNPQVNASPSLRSRVPVNARGVTARGGGRSSIASVRPLLLVVGLGVSLSAPSGAAAAPAPPVRHVLVVVLENKRYSETFGSSSPAPYLSRTLAGRGALLSHYYATGHLSLDDYISMISGQAPNTGTQADCPVLTPLEPGTLGADGQAVGKGCLYPARFKTVADQLQARGLRWRGYMEDMANGPPGTSPTCRRPAVGAPDTTQQARPGDQYAARHNPFVYFRSLVDSGACARYDVDYSRLAKDLRSPKTTPSFAIVTPNLCNDGHDAPCVNGDPGGLGQSDAWLRREVPAILASPGFRDNGLLMITFDEAEAVGPDADSSACCDERPGPGSDNPGFVTPGPGGGRIGAVLLSPFIRPGTVSSTPYNHYGLLRTVEDLFGLDRLGFAARPGVRTLGGDVFNQTPRLELSVRPDTLAAGEAASLRIQTDVQARVSVTGACRGAARTTRAAGDLSLRVRAGGSGPCTVTATHEGWRSARARVRVK